jgi:hypothetical protein
MLESALRQVRERGPPASRGVAYTEERWARFLAEDPESSPADLDEAASGFRNAMTMHGGLRSSVPAQAHIGLARLALRRNDVQGALDESASALDALGRIQELYDVRVQAKVWLVRSQALLRSGDRAGALQWARKALEARLQYDDPAGTTVAAAREALRAASEGSASQTADP